MTKGIVSVTIRLMSEAALSGTPLEPQASQEEPNKRFSGGFMALIRDDLGKGIQSRGAPSKLTEEMIHEITQAIANGVPYITACVAAGVTSVTANRWIQRGNTEESQGKNTTYVKFVSLLKLAAAHGHKTLANEVASNPDWRAKAFILERRYPNEWGKREQVGTQINVVISDNLVAQLSDALKVATNGSVVIDVTPSSPPSVDQPAISDQSSTLGESLAKR